MERLPTKLAGLVLLAPQVHGDERGFFLETYRADAWSAHGVPTEFVQDNHSRSRRGTLRGIHFQTRPGQGKLVRVARGRVLDVAVDLRRGSPTFGEWEAVELDDERGLQLYIPIGFGHGFCVLSETADFVYKCTAYYDPATEAGIRFDDPEVGVRWPARHRAAVLRAGSHRPVAGRDRGHRSRSREPQRSLRPQPDRHPAPRQPAHRAAGLALRPLRRRALPRADGGPRPRPRAGRDRPTSSCATCGRWASTGTARWCSSPTATTPTRRRSTGCAPAGHLYECFCTRAEIRAAASAPHGPLPEGAYPGTCLRLTEAERRRKRAGGRPPALRVRAGGARVAFDDRVRGPQEGVVDDFVIRRNDGAPAYNLAVVVDDAWQEIGEVVRGDDLLETTPRQRFLGDLLGLPAPSYAHVPLVLGADGARLAKRHGAVTLADLDAGAALRWMAGTLGLGDATTPAAMLERFDPAHVPAAPTRYRGSPALP